MSNVCPACRESTSGSCWKHPRTYQTDYAWTYTTEPVGDPHALCCRTCRAAELALDAATKALRDVAEWQPLAANLGNINLWLAPVTIARSALAATEDERGNAMDYRDIEQAHARAEAAEADLPRLREALEKYADPRNWSVRRDPLHQYASAVWIGAGAMDLPVPDAPGIARAALGEDTP